MLPSKLLCSDFKLVYQYKDTTLVQPEVRFGVYPPSKTEKKFVSRHVYKKENSSQEIWRKSELLELKEFVKEQYWVLVDFLALLSGNDF
ncbi:MAG: hypothetical protein F6K23_32865 [Okeania sp. SIO2C9]|uniref:hypothetical protein n=1 Tax=Okeania sp. SIO2C9 TaxID=2607791 RepID=UPI0013BFF199|nr:hypothetical protein [Okeania sp. SIO2C9]NEQ77384.1 hypothetical protein [Okeania sp. SIO2C9]